MKHDDGRSRSCPGRLLWFVLCGAFVSAALLPMGLSAAPGTVTISVVNADTGQPAVCGGFYYTLEEDNTQHFVPGIPNDPNGVLVNIPKSHAPLISTGVGTGNTATIAIPDTSKYYMVTCLPWTGSGPTVDGGPPADAKAGFTMSGAMIKPGQNSVAVQLHGTPIPTAQIWVLAFEDDAPLNGAPDTPTEPGLPGFTVNLFDTKGRVSQDAFGNPLGTTYDASGTVITLGTGSVTTDANGEALIKNIFPGKYGVWVTPPTTGPYSDMVDTSTIEGTPGIDNWVMAGEPPYITFKGLASWHTFKGFVHPTPAPGGTGSVTGTVVVDHEAGPPNQNLIFPGPPVDQAWVSLCDLQATGKQLIYAGPCNADGTFTITGVPPGTFSLTAWDTPALDQIIDFRTVTIPAAGGNVDLGPVAIFSWFGRFDGSVFYDSNGNGQHDTGESGIPNIPINLRYDDGSIYQQGITDSTGHYDFAEVFPFFTWITPEVDNTRYKSTGATVVVDAGGALPDPARLQTPQIQPGGLPYRTDPPGTLAEHMILYGGNTNTIDWGKANYSPGEGGSVYGVVSYDTTRAEDDPRMGFQENWQAGIPGVTINLYQSDSNGVVTNPTPFRTTTTYSYGDNLPTGCVGPAQTLPDGTPIVNCAPTMRTWGQIRPGGYDGMYNFAGLPPGYYVVEMVPPPGYKAIRSQDKNVVFGAAPIQNVIPPVCVGDPYTVDPIESLFPGENHAVPAPWAGSTQRLCNRRLALVRDGQNFNSNFFLYTPAPVAGRVWGMSLNDLALEYNPASPQYGNNLGVSFLPVSIKDYTGLELTRVYTDQWGEYNALVPSTYTIFPPTPTGVSPHMVQVSMNDPGPIPDPAHPGQFMIDPQYNPAYEVVFVELDVWPGTTLYADTPILPIAAFSGLPSSLDCEPADHTPLIREVNSAGPGPYVDVSSGSGTISILAVGPMTIANPDYPTLPGSQPTVVRDYGFGATKGKVYLNGAALPDANVTWAAGVISAVVPASFSTGELLVVRGDNQNASPIGITLHVGGPPPAHVSAGGPHPIQDAIDAAAPGDLIIVGPGTYSENVIMWKKVQLQGVGPFATQILAGPVFQPQIDAWTNKMTALVNAASVDLVPGEAANFYLETAAGITVVAKNDGSWATGTPALVDGFDIEQAMLGGGIYVNGYAANTRLSNNRIRSNEGTAGGGIRIGNPLLECATFLTPDPVNCPHQFVSSHNENMEIHHNQIHANGAIDGAGGIGIFEGADNYSIHDNVVCGNFTVLYGGGISQTGLSPGGSIVHNTVLNNQSFDEGGGIMLVGETVPTNVAQAGNYQSDGTGSVLIDKNLIQGNMGGDNGGGIRLLSVNGEDVRLNPGDPLSWYQTLVANNMIVNNSSGDLGGAIALQDAVRTAIINNTIVHNDSTSTNIDAFGACTPGLPPGQVCPPSPPGGGGITNSNPQVGGLGTQANTNGLAAIMATSPVPALNKVFSNPVLQDDIFWQNRSLWWDDTANGGFGALRPRSDAGAPSPYWDLAVYAPSAYFVDPEYCILSSMDRGDGSNFSATNQAVDPDLMNTYLNNYLVTSKGALLGNTVLTLFLPVGQKGDHHLTSISPARGSGGGVYVASVPQLQLDYDYAQRPTGTAFDAGAAQFASAPAGTADLSITETGSPQGVLINVSTPITYTVVVTNNGPATANGVSATVTLPAGATGVSASSTQGTVTVFASSIGVSLGTLATGGTATITVNITMTATVAFTSTSTVTLVSPSDANLSNNTAVATTSVNAPLLPEPVQNVRMAAGGAAPNGGASLTLTWDPPASFGEGCTSAQYDVLRSSNPADFVTTTLATCVAVNLSATTATDGDLTPMNPGEVRYYLVRDHNACGSNLGTDSNGVPRQGRSCS